MSTGQSRTTFLTRGTIASHVSRSCRSAPFHQRFDISVTAANAVIQTQFILSYLNLFVPGLLYYSPYMLVSWGLLN